MPALLVEPDKKDTAGFCRDYKAIVVNSADEAVELFEAQLNDGDPISALGIAQVVWAFCESQTKLDRHIVRMQKSALKSSTCRRNEQCWLVLALRDLRFDHSDELDALNGRLGD